MDILVFGLILMTVTLGAIYCRAVWFSIVQAEKTSSYPLFAVRDRLIAIVVAGDVSRDDPWLTSVYDVVNTMLTISNVIAGPRRGWRRAIAAGRHIAEHPTADPAIELPDSIPPEELQPILKDLDGAAAHMINNHAGFVLLQLYGRAREAQLRKQKAKEVRESIARIQTAAC